MSAARIPILRILAHAMDLVKVFVKLNAEQDAAWQVVRSIADDPPVQ
jgi:hypothetical protein